MTRTASSSTFNSRTIVFGLLISASVSLGFVPYLNPSGWAQTGAGKKFKILHIMSYHADWAWNADQYKGFRDALTDLKIEYRVFEMDTKRNSSKEWMEDISRKARALIDTWKPDLVYTNDDNAQEYVVKSYVNSNVPFVFSGVNAAPGKYGFVGSKNVAGVLEQEHSLQTIQLLMRIAPEVKKIAIIVDESPMWEPVMARMKKRLSQLPDKNIIAWEVIPTFEEFKTKVMGYQNTADALGLLGIFHFKDESGQNVPYQEVLKWTAENSRLPDFSYWKDRIKHGTLCTVTVSGYEQGLAAGKIARGILVEGRSPSSFPMVPTVKGEPVVSLARAEKLGLKIDSDVLLSSEVMTEFEWAK